MNIQEEILVPKQVSEEAECYQSALENTRLYNREKTLFKKMLKALYCSVFGVLLSVILIIFELGGKGISIVSVGFILCVILCVLVVVVRFVQYWRQKRQCDEILTSPQFNFAAVSCKHLKLAWVVEKRVMGFNRLWLANKLGVIPSGAPFYLDIERLPEVIAEEVCEYDSLRAALLNYSHYTPDSFVEKRLMRFVEMPPEQFLQDGMYLTTSLVGYFRRVSMVH